MVTRAAALESTLGRVRADPRLLGIGVGSLLVTTVAVVGGAAVFEGAVGWSVTKTARGLLGVVLSVALVRSVVLSVVTEVSGRDEATSGGGSSALDRIATAVVAVPVVFAAVGAVTLVAAVPVLAGYGVVVTGLQALGYVTASGPILGPNLVWAGLFFVVLPAATAVGVGIVGPVLPAITRGERPLAALRDGVTGFLSDPRGRLRYGALVVGLTLSPAVVLAVGMALSPLWNLTFAASVGAAPVVGVAAYAVGPLYRTEVARRETKDAGRSHESRRWSRPGRRLTVPRIAAILVVSSVVLGGVGVVRISELRPEKAGADPPGFDGDLAPTPAVRKAAEATLEVDREVEWELRDDDPNVNPGVNYQEGVTLVDPDGDRWYWVRVEPRSDGGDGVHVAGKYRDRNVEIGWGDYRNGHLTGDVGPADGLKLHQTDRDPAGGAIVALDGTGPGADVGRDVSAWTPALRRVANAPNGTFEVETRENGTVVFRTDGHRNYCDVREDRCPMGTEGSPRVLIGSLDVRVDLETGYVRRIVDDRIVVTDGEEETKISSTSTRIWTFDPGPVEIDRPDSVRRGWKELLVDLVVY